VSKVPKVTLIEPGAEYYLIFGTATYRFRGGRPQEVPVAIALEAKRKVGHKNKPIFRVEEMPEILATPIPEEVPPADQNVTAVSPYQMRFDKWP
jgi:hypothetical protein